MPHGCRAEPTSTRLGPPGRDSHLGSNSGAVGRVGRRAASESYHGVVSDERITIEPDEMGGAPCIRGLRIPVATVVAMVADGMTVDEIVRDLPDLEPADVGEALRYAAEAVREQEREVVPQAMPRDGDPAVDKSHLPLVYSCSGCSSAAQMANHIAIALDRRGLAEMSCIAGVGGDVPSLVKVARSAKETGRPIVGIDGCALSCVQHTLARHDIEPTVAHQLQQYAVKKVKGQDFDLDEAADVLDMVVTSMPAPAVESVE